LPAALAAAGAPGDASRQESDQLVKAARAALSANRLDEAEQLVSRAEKLGYRYDPVSLKIDDTPAKVRKDLDAARSRGASSRPATGSRLPALLPNKNEDPRASRPGDLSSAGPKLDRQPAASPFTLRPSDSPQDNDSYPAPQKPSSPSNYESAFGAAELNPNNLPPERNPLAASPAARSGPRDGGYSGTPARPATQRLPSTEGMATTRLPKVDDAVRPAGGTTGRNNDRFPVTQGGYDPRRDNTRVRPVQGESAVVPGNNNGLKAEKAYQEGIDLLENGEREGALSKFSEAWKFQDQLDPATRQDLKDKLSLLRAIPAPSPTAPDQAEPIDAEQHLRYQKFLGELAAEKQAAQKLANENPRQALSNLGSLRQRVADADLDPQGRRILLGSLDRAMKDLQTYIDRNRGDIELRERNNEVRAERARDQQMSIETQNKIAQLVEKFNRLMDEERYAEAEVIAKQVRRNWSPRAASPRCCPGRATLRRPMRALRTCVTKRPGCLSSKWKASRTPRGPSMTASRISLAMPGIGLRSPRAGSSGSGKTAAS
jgi:general secretion pathway protein D